MWCYTFADMPGWQRRMAAWLFNTPPSSNYEEALVQFLKAEEGKFCFRVFVTLFNIP